MRHALPKGLNCKVHTMKWPSRGVLRRLANMWDAGRHRAAVNHVVGDVHYLVMALPRKRTLLTIHDCGSLERLQGWRRLVVKWFWYSLPVRRAALITVVSNSTRLELLSYVRCNIQKVRVIPNCVGSEFVPNTKVFNADCPIFLQIGTGENKNLARVTAALAGISCRLNIVGKLTSQQLADLKQNGISYSNRHNCSSSEIVQAYQECDAVVFVSTYEGFGLPILEANATGRPVITSQASAMPEVGGTAACLVDPFDISSIRNGILKIVQDNNYRESLVQAGFENAKRFSPQIIASRYAELYLELAGK